MTSSKPKRAVRLALVMYTNGGLSGGAAKYLRRLVPFLIASAEVVDFKLFLPRGAMQYIPADWPVAEWRPRRFGAAQIRRLVNAHAPDVVFIPTARWIDSGHAASVVMVRNMEPLEVPVSHNGLVEIARQFGRRLAARRACAKGDRVIAVSNHVADWLKYNWGLADAKLAVIPHGVDPPGPASPPPEAKALAGRRFIFSAGSIRPARGLIDLIEAMARDEVPHDVHLAFAGKVDPGAEDYHAKLLAMIADSGLESRVHWLGQSGREQMNWGFANCNLFVMTSRAEACPNTVLEALSHGCLSVSCDTDPMPEFFGGAALYYSSGDARSLAHRIGSALALSPSQQAELRGAAAERAVDYNWDRCCRQTLALLVQAGAERSLADMDSRGIIRSRKSR